MIFNSFLYIFFLTFIVIVYYVCPERFKWICLLIASIIYYFSFIPVFLFLLIGIVLVNYLLAIRLANKSEGKISRLFILIIFVNILILALFKYFNIIFPGNHVHIFNADIFSRSEPINRMILPLGLSYVTFTVLSYQIEVKRKTIQPEKHLGYFSLYLLFFPKIAQGPIEKPQQLIPQLHQSHSFNYPIVVEGLKLILWGYFKKLVVADRLTIYVDAVYNNSEHHTGPTFIIATIFFAFQIYADFSGYTDIALGSAKLFGFDLTNNFRRPYFATSVKDFWDRWHITFSIWLRDYIFLPFAYFLSHQMNKQKYLNITSDKWIYMIAILVTFAICGIWHGVGWTYLFWGLLFGTYLTYSNWTREFHKRIRKQFHIRKTSRPYIIYKTIVTFLLVSFAWIFFRATSTVEAFQIIKSIFSFSGKLFIDFPTYFYGLGGILFMLLCEYRREYHTESPLPFVTDHWIKESILYGSLVVVILLVGVFDGSQFIYFQF